MPGSDIAELIETLSAAEERLELLTGGQVDAVVTRVRPHLHAAALADARCASTKRSARRPSSTPCPRASRWSTARRDHLGQRGLAPVRAARTGLISPGHGVGTNYLDVCDRAQGEDAPLARAVAAGLRAVLRGELPSYSVEYACHAPDVERWFLLMVSPLVGKPLSGAVLTHFDITERTKAQNATAALEPAAHRRHRRHAGPRVRQGPRRSLPALQRRACARWSAAARGNDRQDQRRARSGRPRHPEPRGALEQRRGRPPRDGRGQGDLERRLSSRPAPERARSWRPRRPIATSGARSSASSASAATSPNARRPSGPCARARPSSAWRAGWPWWVPGTSTCRRAGSSGRTPWP